MFPNWSIAFYPINIYGNMCCSRTTYIQFELNEHFLFYKYKHLHNHCVSLFQLQNQYRDNMNFPLTYTWEIQCPGTKNKKDTKHYFETVPIKNRVPWKILQDATETAAATCPFTVLKDLWASCPSILYYTTNNWAAQTIFKVFTRQRTTASVNFNKTP